MNVIDAGLYWLIPGPRSLIQRIATQIPSVRIMVVNLPHLPVPGTIDGISKGLVEAHLDTVIHLVVRRSTDIAGDVGVHFGNGNGRITAAELARISLPSTRAIVLLPQDQEGQALCDEYTIEFVNALPHAFGNVHLITMIHDPSCEGDKCNGELLQISFDGGLTQDEMEAYVGLRMARRPGPGSTRLMRAIVSEFSGFDAQFSERLMSLDDGLIISIRDHLGMLMGDDHDRWRTLSWLNGTLSQVSKIPHVLHEYYLSEHGTVHQKEVARNIIDRLYWRACLKAITPWIEERRLEVIRPFLSQLRGIAENHSEGKIEIPMVKGTRKIDPEDVEYNNIPPMVKSRQLELKTDAQRRAMNICRLVKPVRDDIAHLRAPSTSQIIDLVQAMDDLVKF